MRFYLVFVMSSIPEGEKKPKHFPEGTLRFLFHPMNEPQGGKNDPIGPDQDRSLAIG